jgi:hypothetical protein
MHMNKHTLSLFSLASTLVLSSGCAVQTIGGVEQNVPPTAVAVLGSAMPKDNTGYLSQLAQLQVVPDSLYVFVGNFDEQCKSPFLPVCEDASTGEALSQWQIILGIPASLQQEGALTLPQTGVDGIVSVGGSGGGSSGATTCGADHDGLKGDVEVTSIDATQVTLHFMGVEPNLYAPQGPSPSITAAYTAPRCP